MDDGRGDALSVTEPSATKGRRTQGVRPADRVTVERIAAAGIRVADAHGVSGLTVRAVAAELGVTKTTITWHIGHHQALLSLVGAAWMDALVPPPGRVEWFVWLRDFAHAYRDAALRQPNVARLASSGLSSGVGACMISNAVVERLEISGLPRTELAHALNAVLAVTIGFVELELHLTTGPGAAIDAIDAARYPAVVRNLDVLADGVLCGLGTSTETRLDASFAYLVDLTIAGLMRGPRPIGPGPR